MEASIEVVIVKKGKKEEGKKKFTLSPQRCLHNTAEDVVLKTIAD